MVIRKRLHWFRMLFIWEGSILPQILPRLIALFLLSTAVVIFHGELFRFKIPLTPAPFTLIGLALAIFLGFCNTASYDRYWEARKLWGGLLIDARSLVRQVQTLGDAEKDHKDIREFANLIVAFSYALKHQLRQTDPTADLARLLKPEFAKSLENIKFKPNIILQELGQWIYRNKKENKMDSIVQVAIDSNLNRLSDILGGCERISNTPIPYAYSVVLHRTIYIYCFLLPFGLVDSIGWMTPCIVSFIGYTFIALDAIVTEIEEPFGVEKNDLALNAICRTIEDSLTEMMGDKIDLKPASNPFIID
ncbi:bestrophin family protein [Dyadobacter frigoris]|uniref:bestrophin family protein n=1 Tax=Dyadobacter frigoris TaxID=2576211 RepID=UPI002555C970|nr:bestrophin family ion channel [Dyadobacter frigoris]